MPTFATQFQESHDQRHDEMKLFERNSLRKAFRKVVHLKNFNKNFKNSYTNVFMFVALTKQQEGLELLLRHDQHKFYHCEFKILEISPQVKPQNKQTRLYPFPNEDILCVGGRLAFLETL